MPRSSRRTWYAVHRWLGLIVGLQMLAWSTGGLVFSWLSIETVRGTHAARRQANPTIDATKILINPLEAVERASDAGVDMTQLSHTTVRQRFGQPTYELFDQNDTPLCAVDAASGTVRLQITETQAKELAEQDFIESVHAISVEFLEDEAPSEFRSGTMPVYRVTVDDAVHTNVYIAPVTGEILKRRNDHWRRFDFFWMLHTMNYGDRDNFNHWLLSCMASLAILTSSSGLVLWWWRTPCRRTRRREAFQTR